MDPKQLRGLLEGIRAGTIEVAEAELSLRDLPFSDLGDAVVDQHRALRQGVAEVVYGEGKTADQIVRIARTLRESDTNVLVTRVSAEVAEVVRTSLPSLVYNPVARTLTEVVTPIEPRRGKACVICAGTSDMPVTEECCESLRMLGIQTQRIHDVGVAGLHRLLARISDFRSADVLIVVAGMEGALPSVVGGLVSVPVIAVPTSVGYGAAFNGLAALTGMLTSCASGITVVNIDNGFGAAFAAARILRRERTAT
ncbi:MAG: nickel pincer cofactor biosynthesis protein LarB [Polyangiaceae bacterium]